jgi:hypothetical protein
MDIEQGHVPISAFAKAIRLRIEYGVAKEFHIQEQILNQAITEETEVWNLRILDGHASNFNQIILGSGKTVNLRVILYAPEVFLPLNGHSLSNMTFIDIGCLPITLGHCTLIHVTTLILQALSIDDILGYSLPSLKHLSIQYMENGSLDPDNFLRLLQAVGTNLVTFLDCSAPSDDILPDDTWTYCPHLEVFQTSFRLPSHLPVKPLLLRVTYGSFHDRQGFDSSRFPAEALYSAGIRLISLGQEWSDVLLWEIIQMEYVVYGMEYGLSFCDIRGVTFQNFIVGMLRYRKRPRLQPIPNWARGHYVF